MYFPHNNSNGTIFQTWELLGNLQSKYRTLVIVSNSHNIDKFV